MNVRVGPCGVFATLKTGAALVFDNIRKCVTPIGPATFKKSLRLFLFFSWITKISKNLSFLHHINYKILGNINDRYSLDNIEKLDYMIQSQSPHKQFKDQKLSDSKNKELLTKGPL